MKEIKGVIRSWFKEYIGDKFLIQGICLYHINREEWSNTPIHTSEVLNIRLIDKGVRLCETRNSLYILLGEELNTKNA